MKAFFVLVWRSQKMCRNEAGEGKYVLLLSDLRLGGQLT